MKEKTILDGIKLYKLEDFMEKIIFMNDTALVTYNVNMYNDKPPKRFIVSVQTLSLNCMLSKDIKNPTLKSILSCNYLHEFKCYKFIRYYITHKIEKDDYGIQDYYNQFLVDTIGNSYVSVVSVDDKDNMKNLNEVINCDVSRTHGFDSMCIVYREQDINMENFENIYAANINVTGFEDSLMELIRNKFSDSGGIEKNPDAKDFIKKLHDIGFVKYADRDTVLYFEFD